MDQPLALRCGKTLNNRLCKVATSEHLGDARSNDATPLLTALYGRWTAGGWGLVITGNVMVDRRALEAPRNVVFDGATDTKQVSHWARSAKGGGACVLVQLSHPGRQSPVAASWRRPRSCSSLETNRRSMDSIIDGGGSPRSESGVLMPAPPPPPLPIIPAC